jgi:hypothetical protein
MNRFVSGLAVLCLLGACSGDGTNPFDSGTTDTEEPATTDAGIPESLAGDLDSFSYDPVAKTLTVTGITQDSSPISATYTRDAAFDTAGYEAYTVQDDALFRYSVALVKQSGNSGSVRAGIAATGGQFNVYHAGGYYERDGSYTPPTTTTGHVRYAGTYAGVTNLTVVNGSNLITPNPQIDLNVLPSQPTHTRGVIILNVDFSDQTTEGAIIDRELLTSGLIGGPDLPLRGIALTTGQIATDGTFLGDEIEYLDDQSGQLETNRGDIGDYGGIFAGPNAESVAGVIKLEEFDDDGIIRTDAAGDPILDANGDPLTYEWDSETEVGVFVLDQCGSADGNNSGIYCDPNAP